MMAQMMGGAGAAGGTSEQSMADNPFAAVMSKMFKDLEQET
jgi:hypothetical protein